MSYHLAQGCDSCTHLVALVQRIQKEAWVEESPVPEELVRAAKAVFPIRVPAPATVPDWLALPRLVGHLVITNLTGPAREGARATLDDSVQVVYEAGDYSVELQVERELESTQLAVVGQIVNRTASGTPLHNVPVVLMARNQLVAQSHCNRFGEFCLVSRVQTGLRVCVPVPALASHLEIPLSKVMAGLP